MPIQRLNHAVLYVRDTDRSASFYSQVLGFKVVSEFPGAVFLQAEGSMNDHDLGLFKIGDQAADSPAGQGSVGLYHLAWEVDTLAELQRIQTLLAESKSLTGTSDHHTTKSLYARDPDGLEFEVAWLVPAEHLTAQLRDLDPRPQRLDLDAEIIAYGPDTMGGVGVSFTA